ncbi:MAG: choice-of-anchor Q domain-containing protein [Pyrinomonadaceae bacterium]
MTKKLMATGRFALMVFLVTAIVSGLSLNLRKAGAQEKNEPARIPEEPVMVREKNPSKGENDDSLSPNFTFESFDNTNPISIPGIGNASPYPSNITVSGFNSLTTKVAVTLRNLSHSFPDDIDIILVGPQGQRSILMSDAGGNIAVTPHDITIDPSAADVLPDNGGLSGNLYRPANYVGNAGENFPSPGPGNLGELEPADLGVFNGTNPNGTWSLYVVDDESGDSGMIAGGWTLTVWGPTVYTVNSTADTSDGVCDATECTLREAITAASSFDLINFSPLFDTPQTINLQTALPNITSNIMIQGKGANLLTVRRDYNAATNFRIFSIPGGVSNVAISGMTITGGNMGGDGGGISSLSNLTLTGVHITGNTAQSGGGVSLKSADGVFTNCTFSANTAVNTGGGGGGIFYQGDGGHNLRLANSTISGNSNPNRGGGIQNISFSGNSRLEVINSTIINNTSTNGGGIDTITVNSGSTATTTLRNTIISANSANNLAIINFGGTATVTTNGFNLSDNYNGVFTPAATDLTNANPRLGPLSLGGGTTPTHALLASSPALDAGDASGYTTDQRGVSRVFGTSADIGAVEMRPIIVFSNSNSGSGTLRDAINTANFDPDLSDILFSDSLGTILVLSQLPNITSSVTLNGYGANNLTVQRSDASGAFRVFNFPNSGLNVAISGMTITGGNAGSGNGGGINSKSNLTLTGVHVTGNTAADGGGISLDSSDGVFTNCTFSGNSATNLSGGGIFYSGDNGRTLRITGSTITGNQSNLFGGGIDQLAQLVSNSLEITNSTIVNNSAQFSGGISIYANQPNSSTKTISRNNIISNNIPNNLFDENGDGIVNFITKGFNLSNNFNNFFTPLATDRNNANAALAPLALNGGTTPTHALLGGSQALDAGNASGFLKDQRGSTRTVDLSGITNVSDGTDIGAFEAQTAPSAPPTVSSITRVGSQTVASGSQVQFNLTFNTSVTGVDPADFSFTTTGNVSGMVVTNVSGSGSSRTVNVNLGTGTGTVRLDVVDNDSIIDGSNIPLGGLGAGNGNFNTGQTYDVVAPAISINDVSNNEGDSGTTNFNFTVSLDISPAQTITVDYATANGTATAGSDYTATNGTVTFTAGQQSKTVTVLVNGDTVVEPNETFFVNLTNPTNATINDNQGQGTIINDDSTSISINDVSQNEGNSGTTNFNFTVSLSQPNSQTVTVKYQTANGTATAPSDYTAIGATTLTFNPNETSKQVTVLVNGDTAVEPDETFFVNLSNPTNATIADNQGQGTILNDDSCSFNLSPTSPQSVPASSSNLNVSVTTQTGCDWSATTSTGWIHINSGSSGTGNGTVGISFDANSGAARSGSLTIAGQTYSINQAAGTTTAQPAPFDYDGDGKTDISIFRPGPGEWWYLRSGNGGNNAFQFGSGTDKLVPADFTGDDKTDIAFWRESTGEWFVLRSEDSSFYSFPFGTTNDIPVPADYDGDGKADPAIFRPSSATWFIIRSTDGGTTIAQFGANTDLPVPADYDGDGKADLAIFRPGDGSWWLNRSTSGLIVYNFGTGTDRTVPGDYTGDGKADVAFWRPTTGEWFILRSEDASFYSGPFGAMGDVPVPGDYDGDGKYDTAVFRPSNSTWFKQGSTSGFEAVTFGIAGDLPTPNAFVR